MTRFHPLLGRLALGAVPLALILTTSRAQQPQPNVETIERRTIRVTDEAGAPLEIQLTADEPGQSSERKTIELHVQVPTSEYWLGVQIELIDDALRTQLNLPPDGGILAKKVMPDSPAAKAGIQDNDVLLVAADKPLKELADLVKAVDEAKDKPLPIILLRSGNKLSVSATPSKRPQEFTARGQNFAPGAPDAIRLFTDSRPFTVKLPEYYLGVECYVAADALRTHLQLPAEQGLVVGEVTAASPAAAAGLAIHDILLSAGDKPLKQASDLVDAVQAAQDKPLVLKGVRAGKPLEVTVTPAKRPQAKDDVLYWRKGADSREIRIRPDIRGLLRLAPQEGAEGAYRLHVPLPGVVLPPGASTDVKLPANVTINISKTGDQPATITVKRDDKTWTVTEKELDSLPPELRQQVSGLLGRGGVRQMIVARRAIPAGGHDEEKFEFELKDPRDANAGGGDGKRLDAIERQVQRLLEEIRTLRGKTTDLPPPGTGTAPAAPAGPGPVPPAAPAPPPGPPRAKI